MNKSENSLFVESVRGSIIAPDIYTRGQVFYDGRPQTDIKSFESDDQLRDWAKSVKSQLLAKTTPPNWTSSITFPDNLWELRIYSN